MKNEILETQSIKTSSKSFADRIKTNAKNDALSTLEDWEVANQKLLDEVMGIIYNLWDAIPSGELDKQLAGEWFDLEWHLIDHHLKDDHLGKLVRKDLFGRFFDKLEEEWLTVLNKTTALRDMNYAWLKIIYKNELDVTDWEVSFINKKMYKMYPSAPDLGEAPELTSTIDFWNKYISWVANSVLSQIENSGTEADAVAWLVALSLMNRNTALKNFNTKETWYPAVEAINTVITKIESTFDTSDWVLKDMIDLMKNDRMVIEWSEWEDLVKKSWGNWQRLRTYLDEIISLSLVTSA